jgi:hypothetical protein
VFVNRATIDWRHITETLPLIRSRSRHTNNICLAEQKNNACVRNYTGCVRFDSDAEPYALCRLYRSLTFHSKQKAPEQNFRRIKDGQTLQLPENTLPTPAGTVCASQSCFFAI